MSEEFFKMYLWMASILHEYGNDTGWGRSIAHGDYKVGNLRFEISVTRSGEDDED